MVEERQLSPKLAYVSFPGASYTQQAASRAARKVLSARGWMVEEGSESYKSIQPGSQNQVQVPLNRDLYLADYDLLPFEFLLPSAMGKAKGKQPQCSSYVIRKALIRKHYLASALHSYSVKMGDDSKRYTSCTPRTWHLDIQFADELQELMMDDLYDLGELLEANQAALQEGRDEAVRWFILKPGMADRGNGIRIFSTLEQLEAIFDQFEPESDDEAEEQEKDDKDEGDGDAHGNHALPSSYGADHAGKDTSVMTSQLRHFVIQEYVRSPLLVNPEKVDRTEIHSALANVDLDGQPFDGARKFHLRAYVLCVGGLSVYLHDDMLALFAPLPYAAPTEESMHDLRCHLTNTCLQEDGSIAVGNEGRPKEENVYLWSDLTGCKAATLPTQKTASLSEGAVQEVRRQVAQVIGATFEAAAKAGSIHWQMWPNAFEVFGVDLLVGYGEGEATEDDTKLKVWLLEVNAQPDFAQTGSKLSATIDRLFERLCEIAVLPFHGDSEAAAELTDWKVGESRRGTTLCFRQDLGRGL